MEITMVDDTGSESTIKVLSFQKVGETLHKELQAFKLDRVHLGGSSQDQEMSWEEQGIEEGGPLLQHGVAVLHTPEITHGMAMRDHPAATHCCLAQVPRSWYSV